MREQIGSRKPSLCRRPACPDSSERASECVRLQVFLSVSVHVDAEPGAGFRRIFTQAPDGIERAAARGEGGGVVVEWIVDGNLIDVRRNERAREVNDLDVSERDRGEQLVRSRQEPERRMLRDPVGLRARHHGECFDLVREVAAWGCVDGVAALLLAELERYRRRALAVTVISTCVPKAEAGNSMK